MHSPALVCIKYRYSGVPPPDLSASQNQQEAFAVLNNNTTSISTETRRRSQDDSFFICSSFLLLLLLFLLLSLFVAVVLSFPFCCYFILVFPSLLYNRGIILFYILLPSFFSIYFNSYRPWAIFCIHIPRDLVISCHPIYQNIRLYPYTTPNVITLLSTGTFFFDSLFFYFSVQHTPVQFMAFRVA